MLSDGWTNGEHQGCKWSAGEVSAERGILNMHMSKGESGFPNRCSEIQSLARYGYGTYETRMKGMSGSGLVSAFFTYIGPADKQQHDESDFEVLGKDTSTVLLNQYIKAKGGTQKLVPVGQSSDQGFNDYAYVWEPARLR